MVIEEHKVDSKTGKEFQSYLTELVDINWFHGDVHHFYTEAKRNKSTFKIEVKKRFGNGRIFKQTGNGFANFPSCPNSSWDHLSPTIRNPEFKQAYHEYEENPLDECNFDDKEPVINILLSFEVARRKANEDYPLRRSEVKDAIRIVMNIEEDEDYKNQVGNLVDMFRGRRETTKACLESRGKRYDHDVNINSRRGAYDAIVDYDLSKSFSAASLGKLSDISKKSKAKRGDDVVGSKKFQKE